MNLRELKYKVGALSSVIIPLGIQGETGATTIRIDYSEWLADGTEGYPSILVLSPNGTRYPAATNREDEISEDGSQSVVVWPITDIDTSEFGDGMIRVVLSADDVVMKSAEARTSIAPSFLKGDEGAPNQYEYWLQELNEKATRTSVNSIAAVNAAKAALQSEISSQNFLEAVRAIFTLIQAEYDPPAYIEGVMALSYPAAVSIEQSEWENVNDEYVVTRNIPLVKTTTMLIFLPDESAVNMEDNIFVGPSANGVARFRTSKLPTGTISGYLAVLGHMNV